MSIITRFNHPSILEKMELTVVFPVQLFILVISSLLIIGGCGPVNNSQVERQRRIKGSAQYSASEDKFTNPGYQKKWTISGEFKIIRHVISADRIDAEPEEPLPVVNIKRSQWELNSAEDFFFAWLGHSSFLISMNGVTILVDPVLEQHAGPYGVVGPERFHPAPVIVEELPRINIVLITHDHHDHLEEDTIRKLASSADIFIAPLGVGDLLESWGVNPEKIRELDWWEKTIFEDLTLTATPAQHYSGRVILNLDGRLWASWSLRNSRSSLFISGDSGWDDFYYEIGERLGPFDATIFEIGAYDEMWKEVHLTPEEAIMAHQAVGGRVLIPSHWATFDMALLPWYEPIEKLVKNAAQNNVRTLTPKVGEITDFNAPNTSIGWWIPIMERQKR